MIVVRLPSSGRMMARAGSTVPFASVLFRGFENPLDILAGIVFPDAVGRPVPTRGQHHLSVGEDHARVHCILLKSVSLQMRLPTDRQPEHPGAISTSHLGVFD